MKEVSRRGDSYLADGEWAVDKYTTVMHELFGDDFKYIHIEHTGDSLLDFIDQTFGCDVVAHHPDIGIFSLAMRVQDMDFKTFTSRFYRPSGAETEYPKRKRQLSENRAPLYTAQCYIDKKSGDFVRGAYIRTRDLYDFFETHNDLCVKRTNYSGEKFIAADWDVIKDKEYEITIKRRDTQAA